MPPPISGRGGDGAGGNLVARAEQQQGEAVGGEVAQQPVRLPVAQHRRIGGRRAGRQAAGPGARVRGVERAVVQHGGRDNRPELTIGRANAWCFGQFQHRVAIRPRGVALRGDEVGAAGRGEDVFVGRRRALGVVAVQQRLRRLAAQHRQQLPAQVVGVLHAAIAAARAERADLMRRIAQEQGAAVAEAFQTAAAERVDADPFQLEGNIAGRAWRAPGRAPVRAPFRPRDRCPSRAGNRCATRCRPGGAAAPSRRGGTAGRTRTGARPGNPGCITTSAIRKRSRNTRPTNGRPRLSRTKLRAPSQASSQSAVRR